MFYFSTYKCLINIIQKIGCKHEFLKTEILSIFVMGARFPRVVRVSPRCRKNLCSCGYSSQTNCAHFVRYALCGVTLGHTFPAGVAALHSNRICEILNEPKVNTSNFPISFIKNIYEIDSDAIK